jgi:hypothetical protein
MSKKKAAKIPHEIVEIGRTRTNTKKISHGSQSKPQNN